MPFYCTYPQLFSQLKQTIFFRTDKKQVIYRSIEEESFEYASFLKPSVLVWASENEGF